MAARVVNKLPEGDEWLYEVKFDGYRALLLKDGDKVRIRSRNDKDLTHAYPTVAVAGQRLKARQAVLDREIVAVEPILRRVVLPSLPDGEVPLDSPDAVRCAEALDFAFRIVASARERTTLLPLLRDLRFPCRGGWLPAEDTTFVSAGDRSL